PSADPNTLGTFEAIGDDVLFLVPAAAPPVDGACAPQSDAGRLEWSSFTHGTHWEVLAVDRGPDGCFALDLGTRDPNGELTQDFRWYLCAPLADLALEPGRLVRLSELGAGLSGLGGILVQTVDEFDGMPRV